MCPAGATVLGDVLIAGSADVVGAVDVPPVPGLGELIEFKELVGSGHCPDERHDISVQGALDIIFWGINWSLVLSCL